MGSVPAERNAQKPTIHVGEQSQTKIELWIGLGVNMEALKIKQPDLEHIYKTIQWVNLEDNKGGK